MKLATIAVAIAVCSSSCADPVAAASVDKAVMLREHSLLPQAKSELIDVIFGQSADPAKARAYYELGSIAFSEKNVSAALDTWTQLVTKYPASPEANLVKARINELSETVGELSRTNAENAVAQSYLEHGNFWSKDKRDRFVIDSSWIPNVEASVKWYDKVIAEYPDSVASRIAHEAKLRTLLGWKETGKYGGSYGVEGDFNKYMPQLVAALNAFEAEVPTASSLQAFRYQIAQAYWGHKDWVKTREWLNVVVAKSGEADTFYRDLALRRLEKVEY